MEITDTIAINYSVKLNEDGAGTVEVRHGAVVTVKASAVAITACATSATCCVWGVVG